MPSIRDSWNGVGVGDWESRTWRLVILRNADGFTAEKPRIVHGAKMSQNNEGLCLLSDSNGRRLMPPMRVVALSSIRRGVFHMAGPISVDGNMHYQTIEASRE